MHPLEKLLRQDGFNPDSWKTQTPKKGGAQSGNILRKLLEADGVVLPEPPKIPSTGLSSENERSSERRLNIPNKQQLMDDAWSRMADPSYPAPTGDPIAAAEGAASMLTGGLAWTATTGLAAEQTHKAMRKAQGTPDQYRVKEIDEEAVARGMEDPRLLGLPPGLSRSIAEQLAPRKEVALTPEEMESKRQNFRDTMQQMFSYTPKTQKGQELTEIAVAPFEALHEASKVASKYWLNKAGIDDPVAESVLTDALEILAGGALFSGATRGRKAYVKSRSAKLTDSRIKKQQRAAQKYLDTLDEFGDPIEAVKKARFDIRSWVDGIVQRFKKDGEISPEAAQKINEMFGEEGKYKGTDIEPLGDPDYERMMGSLEESRGERRAPQRAEGEPLETPYVPPKEVEAPKTAESGAAPETPKTTEPTPAPIAPNKGLKEFWDAEGANFPEFKNRTHLYNWVTARRKKQGEKGYGGHANVPHDVARQAAEAYGERVEAFDAVNEMRKAEGKRKLKRATLISDEELVRVKEAVQEVAEAEQAPVQTPVPKPDVVETPQPDAGGKVIRRRKGEDTVVRQEEPSAKPEPIETQPEVFEDAGGNIADRRTKQQRDEATRIAVSDDPNYRRMRRRQNDLDVEGRTKLRPAEVNAREAGYLDRVRGLWTQGKPRPEIADTIAAEFPNIAKEASGVGKSVEGHIDLDALFNTGKYRDQIKRQQAGLGPKVNDVPESLQNLLDQLGPPKGPNTLRSFVLVDPHALQAIYKMAKDKGVPIERLLQQSGVSDSDAQKVARRLRRYESDLKALRSEQAIRGDVEVFNTGEVINAKQVKRAAKKGERVPELREGLVNMLFDAINREETIKKKELFVTAPREIRHLFRKRGMQVFWHPLKEAEGMRDREKSLRIKMLKDATQGMRAKNWRRVGQYGIGVQDGGPLHLKVMGVEPLKWEDLSPLEQRSYELLRENYARLVPRINEAREGVGLKPLPVLDDYLPSMGVIQRAIEIDPQLFKADLTQLYRQGLKVDQHKPWFTFKRRRGENTLELDMLKVYERYVDNALHQTYMLPLMGIYDKFINFPIPTKHIKNWSGETTRTQTDKDGKKRTVDVTWKLKNTRGGAVKSRLSQYLSSVYGRYPVSAQAHYRNVEQALSKIGKNVIDYYLLGTATSVVNQLASSFFILKDAGTFHTTVGLTKAMNPVMWKKARGESNVVYSRVGNWDAFAGTRKGGQIRNAARLPMDTVDEMMVVSSYYAGKSLAKQFGLRGEKAIRQFAEEFMINTQGSGSMLDVAPIQRTQAGRIVTALQTMVISQWNSFLQDAVGKGQKYQPWNKDATSRLRGLPQTRLATGLRGAIGAALMGKIFEDGLGMYSQVPDPIGALVDGLADDEEAALIVFEIGRELLERSE